MKIIFLFFKYIFNLFNNVFEILLTNKSDKLLKSKLIELNEIQVENISHKQAEIYLDEFVKLYKEIRNEKHEINRKINENLLKNEWFLELTNKSLDENEQIFNKKALEMFSYQERATFCLKFGILFYHLIKIDSLIQEPPLEHQ